MSDLAEMAAEPIQIKVKGEIYTLAPMNLGDWAELQRWAEEEVFKDLQRRLQYLPEKDRELLVKRIMTMPYKDLRIEASNRMYGANASGFQLWLQLRHHHPEITLEKAQELLTFEQFHELSDRLEGGSEEKDPPAKS